MTTGIDALQRFLDAVVEGAGGFDEGYIRGLRSPDDVVYHILDE